MIPIPHPSGRVITAPELHPEAADAIRLTVEEAQRRGLNVHVYEGWRTPERQAALYAKGRDAAGHVVSFKEGRAVRTVTGSRAWHSAHQFGIAADLVFLEAGRWTWHPAKDERWNELHAIAAGYGLRGLLNAKGERLEAPHVQLRGVTIETLREGGFDGPPGWRAFIEDQAERWTVDAPTGYTERPVLEDEEVHT
jgi:peptidoglycan L-alanyl-D-glutamate endopeptidase CwlK